jgi:hypothetical protein
LKPCRFPSCTAKFLYLLDWVAGGGAVLECHKALAQGVVWLREERQAAVLQCNRMSDRSGEGKEEKQRREQSVIRPLVTQQPAGSLTILPRMLAAFTRACCTLAVKAWRRSRVS